MFDISQVKERSHLFSARIWSVYALFHRIWQEQVATFVSEATGSVPGLWSQLQSAKSVSPKNVENDGVELGAEAARLGANRSKA